jgi:hypothetical protein
MSDGKSVNFQGVDIYRPGVYTAVDATAMVPLNTGNGDVAAAIGSADGGVPGKVYTFTNYNDAKAVLKGGPILSFLSRIFNPSPDVPGASVLQFIRAGTPSEATYVVSANLLLNSMDYGRGGNALSYSIDAGTNDAVLKTRPATGADVAFPVRTITIQNGLASYTRSQVIKHGFTVSTTVVPGGSTRNTIVRDVDGATGTLYLIESDVIVATMPIGVTTTVKDVVAWIKSRNGWTAAVVGDYDMPALAIQFPLGVGSPGTVGFDANGSPVTAVSFFTPAAGCGAAAYLLNRYDAQVQATLSGATPLYMAVIPGGAVSQVAFSGGAGSGLDVMSSDDLTAALTLLGTVNIQHLFVQSVDPALHQLAYQFVLAQRTVTSRKYPIFYAGFHGYAATGTYAAPTPVNPADGVGYPVISPDTWDVIANQTARSLDGPVVLCANGTMAANPITGIQEQLSGLGLAAQVCGMAAGNPVAVPVTNKAVISSGLEYSNITDAAINGLLQGGVTIAYYDSNLGRTVIMQALTTYQGGANVSFRKLQGLRVQDAINRGFQAALAKYVGYPLDETTGILIKNDCAKFLDSVIYSGSNKNGYLTRGVVNGAVVDAWDNLTVNGDSTTGAWTINVEAHPVGETDFILVTARLTPVPINL